MKRVLAWLTVFTIVLGISGISGIGGIIAQASTSPIVVNAHNNVGNGSITFTLSADLGGSIDLKYVAYGGDNSGNTEGTTDQIYAGTYSTVGTDTVGAGGSSEFHLNRMYASGTTYPNGYVLFFLKPQSNHLLLNATAGAGTAFYDYYPVDTLIESASTTTLSGYPHVTELAQKAKNDGYVMAFGFSRLKAEDGTASVSVRSEQPGLSITATSDNTSNYVQNDTLNVTVRITPEQISGLTSITLDSLTLTVGDSTVSNYDLSGPDSSGVYTATFSHVLTYEEYSSGNITISATATSTYNYSFTAHRSSGGTSGDTGLVSTSSTVTHSASTSGSWNATFTLKHNANGGTGAPEDQTANGLGQAEFTISSTVSAKEDSAFLGWADAIDASEAQYSAGSRLTITGIQDSERTKTIYAVWASSADNYILNYDANGGNGAPPSQAQATDTFTVSDVKPTRDGYVFEFWAENRDGSGTLYSAGNEVTVTEADGVKSKTLYAVWASNEDIQKKQNVPSVEKKVWNATNSAWQDTTFAAVNGITTDADLVFKITGTLPSNLEGYLEDTQTSSSGGENNSSGAKVGAFTDEEENISAEAGEADQNIADDSDVIDGEDELVLEANENVQLMAEGEEPTANSNEGQNSGQNTSQTRTPIYASYTDYKFTDTYEAGITPNPGSTGGLDLHVYLMTSDLMSKTVTTGADVIDITGLFTVTHTAPTNDNPGRIEVNLKKSDVADADGNTGVVDLKKTYKMKNGEVSSDEDATEVSFTANSKIVVYFTAKLNSSAAVGAPGNYNRATLEFRNAKGEYLTEYTPPDTVKVFTFKLKVKKWKDAVGDGGSPLQGADFKLYKGADKTSVVATGSSGTDGVINFTDLTTITPGTYILEETNSPLPGYNRIADVTINISATTEDPSVDPKLLTVTVSATGGDGTSFSYDAATATITGNVVNKAGSILPNTGGSGTQLFYLLGILLIVTATVGIICKKRKAA